MLPTAAAGMNSAPSLDDGKQGQHYGCCTWLQHVRTSRQGLGIAFLTTELACQQRRHTLHVISVYICGYFASDHTHTKGHDATCILSFPIDVAIVHSCVCRMIRSRPDVFKMCHAVYKCLSIDDGYVDRMRAWLRIRDMHASRWSELIISAKASASHTCRTSRCRCFQSWPGKFRFAPVNVLDKLSSCL